jgi:hypothetical protein
MVCESWFSKDIVRGYRWPKGESLDEVDESSVLIPPSDELGLAHKYYPIFQVSAETYQWPAELEAVMQQQLGPYWMLWVLMGIASRESRMGLLLDGNGLGDSGHGHGIMQIDDRSHSDFCASGKWRDLAASLEYIHKAVIVPAFNYLGDKYFEELDENYENLFLATVAAYNCGPGNVGKALVAGDNIDSLTTGKDYSHDVLIRAKSFKEVLS